jgi:YD repeat-containing protein
LYWQGGIFLATVNGVTQSYDAAGNLTSNGSTTWTYNARGRLVSAKLANAAVITMASTV